MRENKLILAALAVKNQGLTQIIAAFLYAISQTSLSDHITSYMNKRLDKTCTSALMSRTKSQSVR